LVEDDSAAAKLITNFLQDKKWYSVTHALSYNSAGLLFRSPEFSVAAALFDTLIPKCDEALKSDLWRFDTSFWLFLWVKLAELFKFNRPNIPIIWMSTEPENKLRWDWIADVFFKKPLNLLELGDFLDKHVPKM
jgi:hypothetical protein